MAKESIAANLLIQNLLIQLKTAVIRFVFLCETMKILMIVKKRQRIRIKLENVLTNLLEIRKQFHIITTNFF